ncbi:hypothetical protein CYMTET_11198, partial [Cymbomonas tetramitiformis]
ADCGAGWVYYEGECYRFFASTVSSVDARTACQNQGTGGDLVSITSHAQTMFLLELLRANTYNQASTKVHIGLYSSDDEYTIL